MVPIRPAHAQGQSLECWFQDEARVGQKGILTRSWAKRGTRPPIKRDQRHDHAYIFGAVCPWRDKGLALVRPEVNLDAMNLHLAAIATAVPPNNHAVAIIDRAGWHQAGATLGVPYHISLLRLPPDSPELNAQENIWQYLRQNFLAGPIFDTYDAIVDTCCDAWNALIAETGRITSIATRDWLTCVIS